MNPKYQLIVKVPGGLIVRDRPAPESQGARKLRAEPVGKVLLAYTIVNIDGVDYAGLIPQNPQRPEWVRVAEADHSIEYVQTLNVGGEGADGDVARALNRLALAVEEIASSLRSSQ